MRFGSGAYEGAYTFASRFENGKGTNPEELIAAAHAGCFSMALSGDLNREGYDPKTIATDAEISLDTVDGAPSITTIVLKTVADIPGIEEDAFLEIAEGAKKNCPVSRALKGVQIELRATLK